MYKNHMAHLTFFQFFAVAYLLIIFISHNVLGFIATYFNKKSKILYLIILYTASIFCLLLIETSNNPGYSSYFINFLRIMLTFSIILLITKKEILGILTYLVVLISSFMFHYVTIYLSIIPAIYLWFKNKPQKLDMVIETKAKGIISELNEPILILSCNKVLNINPSMKSILGEIDLTNIDEISQKIFTDRKKINNLIKGDNLKSYYRINNDFFKINKVNLESGIILTASDITDKILLQSELEKSIEELNSLSKKIKNYSKETEQIGISKERNILYQKIEDIVKNGLLKLTKNLENIKDCPPKNYESILSEARILLNEVREIVKNWRKI